MLAGHHSPRLRQLDGRPEIVVFKRGNDTKEGEDDVTRNAYPTLFKNEGGTFYGADITLPEVADGTMAVGDFNNDGRPDFVITGRTSEGVRQIWLCLNTTVSEHQYSFNCQQLTGLSQYATIFGAIAAADLNNDGAATGVLMNQGDGRMAAVLATFLPLSILEALGAFRSLKTFETFETLKSLG